VEQGIPAPGSDHPAQDHPGTAAPAGDKEDPVQLEHRNNQVKRPFADIELISKLVEGKFPDFNRVIPRVTKTISR